MLPPAESTKNSREPLFGRNRHVTRDDLSISPYSNFKCDESDQFHSIHVKSQPETRQILIALHARLESWQLHVATNVLAPFRMINLAAQSVSPYHFAHSPRPEFGPPPKKQSTENSHSQSAHETFVFQQATSYQ